MECSVCGEEITHCNECGKEFKKGDKIICNCHDVSESHLCLDCYLPAEEGIVE